MFLLSLGLILGAVVFFWIASFKIPSFQSIEERRVAESTKIYDRTGKILLYDVSQNTKRTIVPIDQISENIKNATVAIEDRTFYKHNGIDLSAIFRAIAIDIITLDFSQGGSTITQQVVKNSVLTNEKWISRKIKELVLALQIEKVLSKDEILSLYLNEIPYGGTIYGVEEASETFFGKNASEVSITEAAYLAAIPQAPTFYSPYGKNRDKLENRKNLVLDEMFENGLISEEDHKKSKEEKVEFKVKEDSSIKAPHFVFFTIDYLKKKYGDDVLEKGGLKVVTTLDYDMQAFAQETVARYAYQNEKDFRASNAAIVAIDPRTGEILTMVGSRNYFDPEIDGAFNVTLAKRQPGSTFKPFVYSVAFKKGYTPETILYDVKTQFSSSCSPDNTTSENGCYSPDDYDLKFRGPVTIRNALAQSLNIPAVKTLYLAGTQESINLARDMGISTISNKGDYGLTLVLGGGEVTPLDMTSAYGVFANNGVRNDYTGILEVKDKSGNVLEKLEVKPRQVLDKEVSLKISSILSDNDARAPAFGQTSALFFPGKDVAVKTGTTNDYRDAWIIGYTPSITVGAWAGNNDNSPMEKRVAGFIVAPLWRTFMDKALAKKPTESFEDPLPESDPNLKPVLSGKIEGEQHTILYWLNKDDPRGPKPEDPSRDSQYVNWEYGVQRWLNGYTVTTNPAI